MTERERNGTGEAGLRQFIALRPSGDFLSALAQAQDCLRAAGVTGRYRDPAGLHMTLAFVGLWPGELTPLLPAVARPFSIRLSRFGVFPGARVLYAGTEPCGELEELAENVRRRLRDAGVPYDGRFCPHITLIRKPSLPEGLDLSRLRVPPAVMTVRAVCLYRSDPGSDGMVYRVIGTGAREKEAVE